MVFLLEASSASPGGLVKHTCLGHIPGVADSVSLGLDPEDCISNEFQDSAAGLDTLL